jgi:hypothetical protein
LDPFPLLFPSPSAATPLVAAVTGAREERSGWVFDPADLVSTLAEVARAPSVSLRGSKDPRCKMSARFILILENLRKCCKLVKCIEYSLFIGKIQMTYQNAQKNELYLFVSKSCMLKQL